MSDPQNGAPPQAALMQMINGKHVSRAVSIVADLGIADLVADGPRPVADLARATDTHPDALYRVLRLLSRLELFEVAEDEADGPRIANSPLSDLLRDDVPGSMRAYARWMGTDFHWDVTRDMAHSVRTGEPAVRKDDPDRGVFEILAEHPEAQERFNEAMTGLSRSDATAIVEAYDFGGLDHVVDVGGGHGTLARAIADAAPNARVTVLDLPHVVEGTRQALAESGLGDRVQAVEGDFFDEVPGPADLCIMKYVIHDWPDDEAVQILERSRAALAEDGRVAVADMLVSRGPEGMPALFMDLEMLIGPGGRERTQDEFRELFRAAGLELERVIPTPAPLRLLESRPV